jgi:hypothetical protein
MPSDADPRDPSTTPRPAEAADSAPTSAPAAGSPQVDEDEDEWRHPPVAPVDERNPLRSLGEAIADTLTGGDRDSSKAAASSSNG